MGAWGFNFFESDHDFDTVSDLSHAAGLDALEAKAKERARQKQAGSENGNATKPAGPTATDEDDDYPLLSIYAGACADVELVRDHLDGGALRKLIDETKAKMEKSDEDDKYADLGRAFATYEFVLLGACAMTLGCKIPDDFKELLIEKYRSTELQRDSLHGMQLALGDGPERYKGTPYDFGSKGLIETANSRDPAEDINSNMPYIGLNVPAPFGLFSSPKGVPLKEYPVGVCGGCGAKDRLDGEPLLSCGKCKTKKYCGKVCQQAHFKQHKRVCKPQ